MKKRRLSITMPGPYVEVLDSLVKDGIYLGRGDAILDALRIMFNQRGKAPFNLDPEENKINDKKD